MFKIKNLEPLPPKKKEQLPNAKEGIPYKEWQHKHRKRHKWRNIRWATLLFFNTFFVLSFAYDISLLEGSFSGSRLMGFYLMDTYNSLQQFVIGGKTGYWIFLTMNFWLGFSTILIFYWLLGGRTFCSWMCPYHFLAEWAEKLHDYFVKKKMVKERKYNLYLKYVFFTGFLVLAFITQQLVFEDLNPVGILSRSFIYGPSLLLLWVLLLLLIEIFFIRHFWCNYICPVGATYGLIGKLSPMSVKFELDSCGHCKDCQDVCEVPHVLWFVQRGKATQEVHHTTSDCTHCGACVDICPGDALKLTLKGVNKLM